MLPDYERDHIRTSFPEYRGKHKTTDLHKCLYGGITRYSDQLQAMQPLHRQEGQDKGRQL